MAIVRILLTEDKAKIVVDKLGLSPELYEWISKKFPNKKYHVFFARVIKNVKITFSKSNEDLFEGLTTNIEGLPLYRRIDDLLTDFYREVLSVENKPKLDLRNYIELGDLTLVIRKMGAINDWLVNMNPEPNIQNITLDEAVEQARQWHEEIEMRAQGQDRVFDELFKELPKAKKIHTFDDGFYWVDLGARTCGQIGDIMGHCGNTSADTLLQLMSPKNTGHMTVSYNYDDHQYTQAKGKGNKKPVEKYHKYFIWLLSEEAGEYQIWEYNSEHKPEADLTLDDLPEDVRDKVLEEFPDFEQGIIFKKAMRLQDEGKEDEALEKINELSGAKVLKIDGESFLVEFGLDDLTIPLYEFFEKIFKTEYADSKETLTNELVELVEDNSSNSLISELEYSMGEDVDLVDAFVIMFENQREATKEIIMNISKENGILKDINLSLEPQSIVEDVVKLKIQRDRVFAKKYQQLLEDIKFSYNQDRLKQFREMLIHMVEMFGFRFHEEDKKFYYELYFDAGYEAEDLDSYFYNEIQYDIIDSSIIDNLYHSDAESVMSRYVPSAEPNILGVSVPIESFEIFKKISGKPPHGIPNVTFKEAIAQFLEIDGFIFESFVEHLILDGYLSSINAPSIKNKNQDDLF